AGGGGGESHSQKDKGVGGGKGQQLSKGAADNRSNGSAHGPSGRKGGAQNGSSGGPGARGGGGGPAPKDRKPSARETSTGKDRTDRRPAPDKTGGRTPAPAPAADSGKHGRPGAKDKTPNPAPANRKGDAESDGKKPAPTPKPEKPAPDQAQKPARDQVKKDARDDVKAKAPAPKPDAAPKPAATPKPARDNPPTGTSGTKTKGDKGPRPSTNTKKPDPAKRDTPKPGKDDSSAPPKPATPPAKTPPAAENTPAAPPPARRPPTQSSREAGYRDGTRAAKVIGHVGAYQAGVKDGWSDQRHTDKQHQEHLDAAHAKHHPARQDRTQQMAGKSSADYHEPQPFPVKSVTATHVHLGDEAGTTFTRGEVRSLKTYERRLTERATEMTKRAERTKGLHEHAKQQAASVTRVLEKSKSVEGGDRLIGSLTRTEEKAKAQAAKAQEKHARALRAAEACRVVLHNVSVRYSGVYKAVVDSDVTAPAELAFYEGN
ncbi:hypothetical protein, partial [Streptomyces sp. NPDC058657]|uniref:hypothetical protein n=1 Tax=Streptomyces sp. NPDC058657 TaxID=3346579 RepID=UPI003663724C